MNNYNLESWQAALIGAVVLWELVWKGFALWRAARNNHQGWFIALMLINSVGILPIVYLYFVGSKQSRASRS
jgi:hypothetical protein